YLCPTRPPTSTLFPYTTLFRSRYPRQARKTVAQKFIEIFRGTDLGDEISKLGRVAVEFTEDRGHRPNKHSGVPAKVSFSQKRFGDRKSTRLNSSHLVISYAVFC